MMELNLRMLYLKIIHALNKNVLIEDGLTVEIIVALTLGLMFLTFKIIRDLLQLSELTRYLNLNWKVFQSCWIMF